MAVYCPLSTRATLLLASGFGFFTWLNTASAQFNNPPGVEIWCGKAYRPENASFNPGGWLEEPKQSSEPRLSLSAYPRWSIYTEDEKNASLVVDAVMSYIQGETWEGDVPVKERDLDEEEDEDEDEDAGRLTIDVNVAETQQTLVSNTEIPVDSTANQVEISLADLPARLAPYEITITASVEGSEKVYTAKTKLYKLPPRSDKGSISKLDNLNGGLWTQSTNGTWASIFPFSYYVNWGGWLRKSLSNLDVLKAAGYNIIHIIPDCGAANKAFNFTELEPFLDRCDEIGMFIQYDMRCTYQNDTMLQYQLQTLKGHKSLLLWYTSDEPDGNGDPLNATAIAYNAIKKVDPYHPVSLVLNCQNFHYKEYSSGADIIMADPYPVGINATYSRFFHTVCNATYGCCGCDNCIGSMADISMRFDQYKQYQQWPGASRKTFWTVPQAFGKDQHWDRYPTSDEVVVMAMLGVNHGAKGVVSWTYPTEVNTTGASLLAKVLTSRNVTDILLNDNPTPAGIKSGGAGIDAAIWISGSQMLVSVVSLERVAPYGRGVEIILPTSVKSIIATPWGPAGWMTQGDRLYKRSMNALETGLILIELNGKAKDEKEDEIGDDVRAKTAGDNGSPVLAQHQIL